MKLVMVLTARDDADVVDAQIAFHLNAGVDFIVASDHSTGDGTSDVLESYARAGYLHRLDARVVSGAAEWRTRMARIAIDEFGADWIIDSDADEFWLPRAETLKDTLVAIPPRYGLVQALARVFPPRPGDAFFADRMTVRRALVDIREDESMGRLDWALRPIHRASPTVTVGGERDATLDGRVPLRAWYPVEVLRFPFRSLEQAERRAAAAVEARSRIEGGVLDVARGDSLARAWGDFVVDDDEVARGVERGELVVDERLRDALALLASAAGDARPGQRFALPEDGVGLLGLRPPTIVADAAYAGECAAVREVDFEPLRERIAQLERRITDLESKFWPSVRRRLRRLARRPG